MAREALETLVNFDSADNRRKLMSTIGAMRGLYDVSITPRRGTASQRQRGYYFGVVLKALMNFEADQGNEMSQEGAHFFFKAKFMREPVIDNKTGEVLGQKVGSIATTDIGAMAEYIDKCIAWLATTLDIIVPEPESYTTSEKQSQ